MSKQHPSLSQLLKADRFPSLDTKADYEKALAKMQRKMLLIQQGIYHAKRRAVIAFEGFDASGKGGAIRRLTENLDPRGVRVIPIGPPTAEEQGRHWLSRFWRDLPIPGTITIFDRTWYGRVLVERVDALAAKPAWKRAYDEINEFEQMLVDDGVDVIKIFLAISKDEQLDRFQDRLEDPYKRWKIGESDVRARQRWDDYVAAMDDAFARTDTPQARWHLVAGNHKWYARTQVLELVTSSLSYHADWMRARVDESKETKHLSRELKKLR